MNRMREFDDILNECIERVLKGDSIEDCLAAFPEHAGELEPLLRTAADTRKAAAIMPRPEFRQRAGYEFQVAIRDMGPKRRGFFQRQIRWVAVVSVLVAILLASSGTVAAASSSLPDGPLYQVKLATEDIRLALTPSATGKAELYAKFTDERVNEIIMMADKGKVAQVVKATERMNDHLTAIAKLALPVGEVEMAGDALMPALMAGQSPAPATAIKPVPVPTPTPDKNVSKQPFSANISSPQTTGRQDVRSANVTAANAEKAVKEKKPADLKTTISNQAEKNAQELEKVLKRVPDNVKPALERAISVAGKGYDEALKNINKKK